MNQIEELSMKLSRIIREKCDNVPNDIHKDLAIEISLHILEEHGATQPSVEAEAGHLPFCPKCGGITVTKCMNCDEVW